MPSIEALATFVFTCTMLALAPGPDNIFVMTQGALYGRRAGILVTLGLSTGLIYHTTAVALGLAAIIQASPKIFSLVKILGAGYLLYLAWLAFRASASSLSGTTPQLSGAQLFRRGIIMNITNPKVTVFCLAFLPQFTSPENGPLGLQIFWLGLVFICVTLVVFGGIAFLAGSVGSVLNSSPRHQIWLNRIAGTVFAVLAIKLVSDGISR